MHKQMDDFKQELHITLKVLEAKNTEIDNQKQTICNLQDALVALKRSSNTTFVPNGKTEFVNTNLESSNIVTQRPHRPREVFDV